MDRRKANELLSVQDQVKYNQLKNDLTRLERYELVREKGAEKLGEVYPAPDENLLGERVDQLTTKLELLKTLIRAGNLNQLQELVRKAKI